MGIIPSKVVWRAETHRKHNPLNSHICCVAQSVYMIFGVFDFLTECGWHISMSQWNQTSGNRNCLFCLQNIVMLYAGPTWMLYDTRTPTAFRVNFDVIVSIFVGSLSFPFTYFVFLFLFNIRVGPRTLLVDELVLHWSRYSGWMFSNYSRLAPARSFPSPLVADTRFHVLLSRTQSSFQFMYRKRKTTKK